MTESQPFLQRRWKIPANSSYLSRATNKKENEGLAEKKGRTAHLKGEI